MHCTDFVFLVLSLRICAATTASSGVDHFKEAEE